MSLVKVEDIEKRDELPSDKVERFFKIHSGMLFENYTKLAEWAPFSLIKEAMTVMYVSYGDWSTHDLLFYFLRHIGPSNIYLSTWAISEDAVRLILKAKNAGLIKNLYVVADRRLKIRNSEVNALLNSIITEKVEIDCHAKVFVIEGQEDSIVNVGSGNLSNNKTIESGVVSVDEEAILFHKSWIMREIKKGRKRYEGTDTIK